MDGHQVTMLGTGLIGLFYTRTLHGQRNRDRVHVVYSRSQDRAEAFAREHAVPNWSTDLEEAIAHPDTDTVVIGLPNHLHEEAIATRIKSAYDRLLAEADPSKLTRDLGGTAGTDQFTDALIATMQKQ